MATQRQVARCRESRDAGTDDRDCLTAGWTFRLQNDGRTAAEIGRRALGKTNCNGFAIALPSMPAGAFAGPRTYPSQHSREYVVPQIDFIGLGEAAVIDRFEIAWNIGPRRTGRLAGNVFLEPMQVLRCSAVPARDREGGGGFEISAQYCHWSIKGQVPTAEAQRRREMHAKEFKKLRCQYFRTVAIAGKTDISFLWLPFFAFPLRLCGKNLNLP
jgi:hypothetical protein